MSGGDRARRIEAWLGDRVSEGRMPGAAWWVGGGRAAACSGALGLAAVEPSPEPARPDTVYDLASLTKPLATATLAALLERDGVVDLAGASARWLPELSGSPYAGASLLDLAAHRAGLPAWRPLYLRARGREAYLRAIAGEAPAGPAGTTLYSDLGYVALGIAIERAAERDLATLFRERVAVPLGLRDTGYGVAPDRLAAVAPTERGNAHERALAGEAGAGYPFRESILRGVVHDGNAAALGGVAGHAGLFGTAADVARVALAWLAPAGPLGLDDRARRRILVPVSPGGDRTVGLVLARASGAARGALPDDAPGHVGFTGTSLWLLPEAGEVAVLLANRVHPAVAPGEFQDVRLGFHRAAFPGAVAGATGPGGH